jgi:hypothetical protein
MTNRLLAHPDEIAQNDFDSKIPLELADAFTRNRAVIVVGPELSASANAPILENFRRKILERLDDNLQDIPDAHIIDYYESEYGRFELLRSIREQIDSSCVPTPAHTALVKLPAKAIFTTNLDGVIEQALRNSHRIFNRVVRPSDLAFIDPGRLDLVKIYGDIMQPDTIVLTTLDHEEYFSTHEDLANYLRVTFSAFSLQFLGYPLDSYELGKFLVDARAIMYKRFLPSAYAVTFGADDYMVKILSNSVKLFQSLSVKSGMVQSSTRQPICRGGYMAKLKPEYRDLANPN